MSSDAKKSIKVICLCVVLVVSVAVIGGHISDQQGDEIIEKVEHFEGELLEVYRTDDGV